MCGESRDMRPRFTTHPRPMVIAKIGIVKAIFADVQPRFLACSPDWVNNGLWV